MEDERGKQRNDQLLGELRRIATDLDAVPDDVTGFAKAALGWRRMDAELAELLADSATEREALARSLTETREVSFRASGLEIELEIQHVPPRLLLLGQLEPPVSAAVEVQRDDGSIAASADADELGRFRIELPTGGRIRLRVTQPDPATAQAVETSWLTL